jgi:hypothetical protein
MTVQETFEVLYAVACDIAAGVPVCLDRATGRVITGALSCGYPGSTSLVWQDGGVGVTRRDY